MYYEKASEYIGSATSLQDKLARYDAIIEALELKAVDAVGDANFSEYSLNDGQTTIRAVYKDHAALAASIQSFERLRQGVINKLNGRSFQLRHGKNF